MSKMKLQAYLYASFLITIIAPISHHFTEVLSSTFLEISTFQCRYLIKDCPQVCNNIAYFKVVCYTQDQQSFPVYNQERPAFILAAPSYLAPFPNMSNNLSPPLCLPTNPYPTLDDECHDVLLGIRERC